MPPCNWPQNSVFVTEFALWRSLCSSTLSREERGSIAFALLWLCLRKLFRQLLFVACNAVSSYPLLTASHPQVDHKADRRKKNCTFTKHIGQCISRALQLFNSASCRLCGLEDASVESFTRCEPGINQHCTNISFLIQRDCKF